LQAEGFELLASFEQEFVYTGVVDRPGRSYALEKARQAGVLGEAITAALRAAGLRPDSFLPEYGPRQFELTIGPTRGLRAADEAVITREMVRAVAHRLGERASFAPMVEPDGIGNGTHVHFSLRTTDGQPAMHDPDLPHGLSQPARHFVAGILAHLPALSALTAASVVSYLRLTPNRWAPTRIDLGEQDRGSALRICPVFATSAEAAARQFNVEYRVADAAASPYMVLAAIVHAGLDGLRQTRELPDGDDGATLPQSLAAALDALEADVAIGTALGPDLLQAYVMLKRSEIEHLDGLDPAALCARYTETY
jgi:glutamine synthetase